MVYLIICVVVFAIIVACAFIRSGQISEMERREFYDRNGYWPEW